MSFRQFLGLFFLGLWVALTVMHFQTVPGYMDADYYFADGYQLGSRQGFVEPFLWNYLDNPQGIPHPAFAYWTPLASFLAATGIILIGKSGSLALEVFNSARLGFIILASFIPPLTAALAYAITRRKDTSFFVGLLSCFSGFYLPYIVTTDTFSICMVIGALWLLIVGYQYNDKVTRSRFMIFQPLILGLLSGLMHLARADGLIWFAVTIAFLLVRSIKSKRELPSIQFSMQLKSFLLQSCLCLAGYLVVMGPWIARNYEVFGSFLSPGGVRALWFINYNDLYAYPASIITPARWLQSGLLEIIRVRLWALSLNLQTAVIVQGQIYLTPLILIGLWRLRNNPHIRWGGLVWILVFLSMTFLFPFPGARGGLFHSGAAVQPMLWAVVPVGLSGLVELGSRYRKWNSRQATRIFGVGIVGLGILISVFIISQRVIGPKLSTPRWEESADIYRQLDQSLTKIGAQPEDIVMVNNPPGYFIVTARMAISCPSGDLQTQLAVANRYHARYLLLESNHPPELDDLYINPRSLPGLSYLLTVDGAHIFKIE